MYNLVEYEVLKWGKKITDSLFFAFSFLFYSLFETLQ